MQKDLTDLLYETIDFPLKGGNFSSTVRVDVI